MGLREQLRLDGSGIDGDVNWRALVLELRTEKAFAAEAGGLEGLRHVGRGGIHVALRLALGEFDGLEEDWGIAGEVGVNEEIEDVEAGPSVIGEDKGPTNDGALIRPEQSGTCRRAYVKSLFKRNARALETAWAKEAEGKATQDIALEAAGEEVEFGPGGPFVVHGVCGGRGEILLQEVLIGGALHQAGAWDDAAKTKAVVNPIGRGVTLGHEEHEPSSSPLPVVHLAFHKEGAGTFEAMFGYGIDVSKYTQPIVLAGGDVTDGVVSDQTQIEPGLQALDRSGERLANVPEPGLAFMPEEGEDPVPIVILGRRDEDALHVLSGFKFFF